MVTWNAPRFPFLRLSQHLPVSLSVTPTRGSTIPLSPLTVRFHLSLFLVLLRIHRQWHGPPHSSYLHSFNATCGPWNVRANPSSRAQCRTYGIVYPRSHSLDIRPLDFPQKCSALILHEKVYLIRARHIFGAFRFRENRILE